LIDHELIFNGDELGLFWKMLPTATYVIKDNMCKLGKQSKERFTVFLGANMTGSQKLPPAVIYKSENPRNMHLNKKLPIKYYSHKSGWMSGGIFLSYLTSLNKDLIQEKKSIILFVEN
jgi:hypothetical protein